MASLRRLYTPNQVALAVLLGGPLALMYSLRANFISLERQTYARRVIYLGILLAIGLCATVLLFPGLPSAPLVVAQVVLARGVASTYQKIPDAGYAVQSNVRAITVGVLSLAASILIIGGTVAAAIFVDRLTNPA